MKNLFSIIKKVLTATILLTAVISTAEARYSPFVNPPASYLIVINGKIFLQKDSDVRRAPASLTKVMTALVVLEHCNLEEVVRVNSRAAAETGSRIGLRKGDRLTVHSLLAATLVASANDACRALAEHVGGNQQKFVAIMNRRAHELGLRNTRFCNACGHDERGHYSTSHDLMLLANEALRNPCFANLVATREIRITTVTGKRAFAFRNKNRLIGRYAGAKGVKTGTTPRAGQCLIALAERGDTRVLLVMMRSTNRWRAAPALLDAAFAGTEPKEAAKINGAPPERAIPEPQRPDEPPDKGVQKEGLRGDTQEEDK